MTPAGFPHSEILGSQPGRRLPEAYRSHPTSFIGSWCQGIHRAPLTTCTTHKRSRCPRPLCNSQTPTGNRPSTHPPAPRTPHHGIRPAGRLRRATGPTDPEETTPPKGRSLRTQQCATDTPHPAATHQPAFPTPRPHQDTRRYSPGQQRHRAGLAANAPPEAPTTPTHPPATHHTGRHPASERTAPHDPTVVAPCSLERR